jgi:hypothetical protein
MAYETGAVSNGNDMVAKIEAMLRANGVTILNNYSPTAPSGLRGRQFTFQLESGGMYFTIGCIGDYHSPIEKDPQNAWKQYAPSTYANDTRYDYGYQEFIQGPRLYYNPDGTGGAGYKFYPTYRTEFVYLRQHKNFDASKKFYEQTGAPLELRSSHAVGYFRAKFEMFRVMRNSPAYHLFYDPTNKQFHAVCEYRNGQFSHLGFGLANKTHNFTGGSYSYCNLDYMYPFDADEPIGYQNSNSRVDLMSDNYRTGWSYHIEGNGEDFYTKANNGFGRMTWFNYLNIANMNASYQANDTYQTRYAEHRRVPNWTFENSAKFGSSVDVNSYSDRGGILDAYDKNNNNLVMYPEYQYCRAIGGGVHLLSSIDLFRRVTLEPYLPGEEVAIGGDTYIIFPQSIRHTPWAQATRYTHQPYGKTTRGYQPYIAYTRGLGLAIKKVT